MLKENDFIFARRDYWYARFNLTKNVCVTLAVFFENSEYFVVWGRRNFREKDDLSAQRDEA